ncbi:unnamed protein product [Schistosoma curassoni]|uniref:Reverse transcriptase domain-containing protein n=1 Tax=Schistosoma curassoni TaxID=6186 RepID=A0A183K746_9TREM|nr:unnamed protein product [Schistosoma curassoni]
MDRRNLTNSLRRYEVFETIVTIMRNSYDGQNCEVVYRGQPLGRRILKVTLCENSESDLESMSRARRRPEKKIDIVSIDRLKTAHVDDSALRFNARPIKPTSRILKPSSGHTLDTPETSFPRPSQQHASSAPSTYETLVSRPDQQTAPPLTSDEIAGSRDANEAAVSRSDRRVRLPPAPQTIARLVSSTSVNFGESWTGHPRSSQRTQLIFWFRMFGIRLVPNLVVMVASGSSAQRGFVLRLKRFWVSEISKISNETAKQRTIEDVRTKGEADIASDHQLLVAKMKLKLKKHWTMGRAISQKFNTAFLQDTNKLNKFKIHLSNKFQAFHDLLNGEGTTMESNWKGIKEAITSTCHEVLGHKKHYHKEWITVDTLDTIQERRNKKAAINTSRTRAENAKAQAEYTEVNKQAKRSIRTDKRKYVVDLATTAEKAAREGNMRQLHDTTKKLSGNRRKPERPVKSKEGEVITNIEEQQNRWVEHFKELLNHQLH